MLRFMNYSQRYLELKTLFKLGADTSLNDSGVAIRSFTFNSEMPALDTVATMLSPMDYVIEENLTFEYPMFVPDNTVNANQVIVLLHGLNERNWNKYLTWAEYLCLHTQKPVLLFPIAFHMNRSPNSWSNPRALRDVISFRRKRNGIDRFLSLANVSFSERISENPFRFYSSGRQSINDLQMLALKIYEGKHPYLSKGTKIDIFAYSIGCFLAEVMIMAYPQNLFSDSKLFLFCGGGVFSSMFGQSKCIMDQNAYKRLNDFYKIDFRHQFTISNDLVFQSFIRMIDAEEGREEREIFFRRMSSQVKGTLLKKDEVMPFSGLEDALGKSVASERIAFYDATYTYTHENPFPILNNVSQSPVDELFNKIFSEAAFFLAS